MKFANNIPRYIEAELQFQRWKYVGFMEYYPVFRLLDISIHMQHYHSIDVALSKWNERKKRIQWNNLCVVMGTNRLGVLRRFNNLPIKKKVCFDPFESNISSAFCVDVSQMCREDSSLAAPMTRIGAGVYPYYYNKFLDLIKD